MASALAALAQAMRTGRSSARQLAEGALERIARHDQHLNAFVCVEPETLRREADALDRRLAQESPPAPLPLAGLPIAIKDNIVSRELPTSCGSRMLAGWRAPYEATVLTRLRAAGALVLGKTNLDEFAMGSSTETGAFGPCHNPWDRTRVAGGSSGGSAAAVAAELAPAALGSDTGGSLRQPAAFCGVSGLKPTYGRVSRYGLIAFASSLEQIGPLAHAVEDVALLHQVIAGHDARDATSLAAPLGDAVAACHRPIAGLRVGVLPALPADDLQDDVAAAVAQSLATLAALGVQIVELTLPQLRHAVATYYLICMAEASSNLARFDGLRYGHRAEAIDELVAQTARSRSEGFGAEVRRRILLGTFALSAGRRAALYDRAQAARRLLQDDFARAFAHCDAIALPTTPSVAFPLGERLDDPARMYLADRYTTAASLAGLPALSLPCGSSKGLPIGLQLIAPTLAEETLFALGGAFQRASDWHLRRPPLDDRVEQLEEQVEGAAAGDDA